VKAILPLHYMGVPCDLAGVYELADACGLRVVEDACHAIGTVVDGRHPIGSRGDLQCFSFDPIKTMTCIDGGAVACSSEDAETIRRARLLGVVHPPERQYVEVGRSLATSNGGYDVEGQGFRYHLSNLNAAIGLTQLERLATWIKSRRAYATVYKGALDGVPVVTPRGELEGVSLFGFAIRVLDGEREDLRRHLAEREIDTGVHWRPGHWLSWLADCRGARHLPVSDQLGNEITTLPLWSEMDALDLGQVVDAIWTFYE
jgi:dTDP-4-amino-4,6-dideoxygalactose transaminase